MKITPLNDNMLVKILPHEPPTTAGGIALNTVPKDYYKHAIGEVMQVPASPNTGFSTTMENLVGKRILFHPMAGLRTHLDVYNQEFTFLKLENVIAIVD